MKKLIILLIICCLLTSCSSAVTVIDEDIQKDNNHTNEESDYYIVNSSSDFNMYNDLQELIKVSGFICIAKITNSEVKRISSGLGTIKEDIIATVLDASIEKCYKGDLKEGDVIQIAQHGGKLDSEKIIENYSNIKYLINNDTYLLFLYDYTDIENERNWLVNPLQGCYVIDENNNITPYNDSNIIINSLEDLIKACTKYSENPEKANDEKKAALLKEKELYQKILNGDSDTLMKMNIAELNNEIIGLYESELKRVEDLLSKID